MKAAAFILEDDLVYDVLSKMLKSQFMVTLLASMNAQYALANVRDISRNLRSLYLPRPEYLGSSLDQRATATSRCDEVSYS